jgi:glutathione S-transferase
MADRVLQISGARGVDRLVPEDPVDAAQCRIWADKVNRECCSPYYAVLVRKDPGEQRSAFEALVTGLRSFSAQLEKTKGPLFLPDAQVACGI